MAGARCADRISVSSRMLERKAVDDEDEDDSVAAARRCKGTLLAQGLLIASGANQR